ncbi:hypothetical protein NDU88_000575 [Pleurodeles waltl]|uniref:Uncharacterized protein n=1 Tax=Pleurodeles waltl TaxID=8319 RepID=A0AAV7KMF1_PLEWA|nr:hypothetical protein NDU88_000575 [Pleurodeles waltl]
MAAYEQSLKKGRPECAVLLLILAAARGGSSAKNHRGGKVCFLEVKLFLEKVTSTSWKNRRGAEEIGPVFY